MNLYLKFWKSEECDSALDSIYGVRLGKHAKSKDRHYRAAYLDFISPFGLLQITVTDSHRGYYEHWKRYWDDEIDWQLFGKK